MAREHAYPVVAVILIWSGISILEWLDQMGLFGFCAPHHDPQHTQHLTATEGGVGLVSSLAVPRSPTTTVANKPIYRAHTLYSSLF